MVDFAAIKEKNPSKTINGNVSYTRRRQLESTHAVKPCGVNTGCRSI